MWRAAEWRSGAKFLFGSLSHAANDFDSVGDWPIGANDGTGWHDIAGALTYKGTHHVFQVRRYDRRTVQEVSVQVN